jgi:Major Facilitator Superfamily.
MNSATSG